MLYLLFLEIFLLTPFFLLHLFVFIVLALPYMCSNFFQLNKEAYVLHSIVLVHPTIMANYLLLNLQYSSTFLLHSPCPNVICFLLIIGNYCKLVASLNKKKFHVSYWCYPFISEIHCENSKEITIPSERGDRYKKKKYFSKKYRNKEKTFQMETITTWNKLKMISEHMVS